MFRTDWSKHSDTHICNRSEQSTLVYLQLFSFSLFRAHACDFQSNYFIIHAKSNDLLLSLCPCLMIWPAIRSKDFRTISIAAPKCYKWMWYWIGNRLWLKLHSICPPKSDLLMLKTKSLNRSVTAGPTFGHSSGSVVAYKFKIKQSITLNFCFLFWCCCLTFIRSSRLCYRYVNIWMKAFDERVISCEGNTCKETP